MSKFQVLVGQLYKQKIKAKSFLLTTAFYIAAIGVVIFWSDLKEMFFSNDEKEVIAVFNETSFDIQSVLNSNENYEWVYIEEENTAEKLETNEYIATFLVKETNNQLEVTIQSYDPLPLNQQNELKGILSMAHQMFTMSKLELTEEQQNLLLSSQPIVTMNALNLGSEDGTESGKTTEEKEAGIWISYVVGFIIYFFVATYLSMITTEVASEKGSRALEMLLVSVRPETHFRAKIFGVSLVAITQFFALVVPVFLLIRFVNNGEKWELVGKVLETISLDYFIYIVSFLFVTILLYLVFGALFGSLVSKVEEAAQVMMPALMLTLIGFYVMIFGMFNPDTLLIKIFSYIPFTSGMVMPMRIGATDISMIEPLISLVILVLTTGIFYYFSLTLYKRSVLTYSSGGIIEKIKTVFKVTT